MSLPLLAAYEIEGDVICPDCFSLWHTEHAEKHDGERIPIFSAELKPTDQCIVCKRFLLKDPVDA